MTEAASPTIELNNEVMMPQVGLGMWQMRPSRKARKAIQIAFDAGYRHLDTAALYNNEDDAGVAVRESALPREDIFVTTKLWNSDHGYDDALRAFDSSLKLLEMDYVDLYLIHWPVSSLRRESWRALERLYDEGLCKAIGVSNYMVQHLEEMDAYANLVPAVNQIELHAYNYRSRTDILEMCGARGIAVQAYSPLTKGRRLRDKKLVEIAERYEKSAAQVLLRWLVQKDLTVLPKSSNEGRIRDNIALFDWALSDEDMMLLEGFDENEVTSWDPTNAP